MNDFPSFDEFILSFGEDKEASPLSYQTLVSDLFNCTLVCMGGWWYITLNGEQLDSAKWLCSEAYEYAYQSWCGTQGLPNSYEKSVEEILRLRGRQEDLELQVEQLIRNREYHRLGVIRCQEKLEIAQEVRALMAEKLFYIAGSQFNELWVVAFDGDLHHPLNYEITKSGLIKGTFDLRLDGFVVDLAIPTIDEAKKLAYNNYTAVREFNP